MKTTLLPVFTFNHFPPAGVPQQLGQFRDFLSHCVPVLYILKEAFKPFWTQRKPNLQKTVKRLHENSFKALAPAACVTQTLRESETWSESPQRYCALWAAASSLWAGVTAEWGKAEANCCLNPEGSSTAFMEKHLPSRSTRKPATFCYCPGGPTWSLIKC